MKRTNFILLFIGLPFFSLAQTKDEALQSVKNRNGWYVGLGIYYADQNTHWKYDQTAPAVGVPFYNAAEGFGHDVSRTLLMIGIEKKSIFGTPHLRDGIFVNHYDYYGNYVGTEYDHIFNFIDFDFGADLMTSPASKTNANWLNEDNNQISSGGLTAGASAYIRAQWVVLFSSKLRISVFSTTIGTQYMYLHNNGKGVSTQPLVHDFNYDKGWNENIASIYLSVGTLGIETGNLSITPEVRVLYLASATSSLKPERIIGDVKTENQPSLITYGVKILQKF